VARGTIARRDDYGQPRQMKAIDVTFADRRTLCQRAK
jgi:hypothetical protein